MVNKSGLPPMINPNSRALRPGGAGTVKPGKAKALDLGSLGGPKETGPNGPTQIGKGVPVPKFARGGSTSRIPKMPKLPKIG